MPSNKQIDIEGVGEGDFQNWKHHPVTKVFMRYLADYRAAVTQRVVGQWEAGALKLTDEQEARGRSLVLMEMQDLRFDHMVTFYGLTNEDETKANGS